MAQQYQHPVTKDHPLSILELHAGSAGPSHLWGQPARIILLLISATT